MKKLLILFICLNFTVLNAFSAIRWKNDTRELFQKNRLKIMEINPRTFSAKDLNDNGIIEFELGEQSGNFHSAIERLDELKEMGINAIHVMPITPTGKLRALGTAGSLYALSDFLSINPQLKNLHNDYDIFYEFENFVYECHLRGIRVIVDMPSCGSYDLFLKNPELFYLTDDEKPISPADWLDVFLFKTKNDDGTLNEKLFDLHKGFIDLLIRAKVDGVRADVATIKPYEFWDKLIKYARAYNTEFLFLAEASDSWTTPPCEKCEFTPYNKLLAAGFDGYYSSYFNFKDWNKSDELKKQVMRDIKLSTSFKERKSAIASFMTHDEQSPMLLGGYNYTVQLIWLNALLPLNSYFVDGIQYGDNYIYPYANKEANKTYTDNLYYYVHKGKPDIFNFAAQPKGDFPNLKREITLSNNFKTYASDVLSFGSFNLVKTSDNNIFSFIRKNNKNTVLVILNKSGISKKNVTIKHKDIKHNDFIAIKSHSNYSIIKNKIEISLEPYEIIVLYSSK